MSCGRRRAARHDSRPARTWCPETPRVSRARASPRAPRRKRRLQSARCPFERIPRCDTHAERLRLHPFRCASAQRRVQLNGVCGEKTRLVGVSACVGFMSHLTLGSFWSTVDGLRSKAAIQKLLLGAVRKRSELRSWSAREGALEVVAAGAGDQNLADERCEQCEDCANRGRRRAAPS